MSSISSFIWGCLFCVTHSLPGRFFQPITSYSSPFGISPTFTATGQLAAFTPTPTFPFSASVNLGTPLGPIPLLEGGQRIVEPITGGTITGPEFQATIEGGLAAPIVVSNSNGTKTQLAFIYAYGHANDGPPFYLDESGIGAGPAQTTRITVNAGGKHDCISLRSLR